MDSEHLERHAARRRSALAGMAGVGISLGLTELIAGISTSVPSAISAIGSFVVDYSPAWLESFAISVFGTADKAVLAISIVAVVLAIGWFVGRASYKNPAPMAIAFTIAGVLGIAAQLTEPGAEVVPVVASTCIA
ncbi:MAG: hypothetical protein ACR2N7_06235, partial [Acidimicrobiia bacterium]